MCFRGAKVLVDGGELFVHLSNELDILKTLLYLKGDKTFVIGKSVFLLEDATS